MKLHIKIYTFNIKHIIIHLSTTKKKTVSYGTGSIQEDSLL